MKLNTATNAAWFGAVAIILSAVIALIPWMIRPNPDTSWLQAWGQKLVDGGAPSSESARLEHLAFIYATGEYLRSKKPSDKKLPQFNERCVAPTRAEYYSKIGNEDSAKTQLDRTKDALAWIQESTNSK
jgi:hypothetical protein